MLTFFCFLFTLFGSINWFFIGAFQYDIIAGFFGFQASLMSRVVYFLIGVAGFVLFIMALKNKGTIKITENAFKKKNKNNNEIQEEYQNEKFENNKIANNPNKEEYKDFDITKYDN